MTNEQLRAILASHKAWLEGKAGQRANLRGANLDGANLDGASLVGACLVGANLTGANLDGASLVGAYLVGASLARANLDGANLTGANLFGADLRGAQIEGQTIISLLRRATRSDGHGFFLWHCKEGFFIKAGCRFMDMKGARQHWKKTRGGTPLGDETLDILRFFAAAIRRAKT